MMLTRQVRYTTLALARACNSIAASLDTAEERAFSASWLSCGKVDVKQHSGSDLGIKQRPEGMKQSLCIAALQQVSVPWSRAGILDKSWKEVEAEPTAKVQYPKPIAKNLKP